MKNRNVDIYATRTKEGSPDTEKIKDVGTFWKNLNKDYRRKACFRDYIIEDIQADRNDAKAWIKSQTPSCGGTVQ